MVPLKSPILGIGFAMGFPFTLLICLIFKVLPNGFFGYCLGFSIVMGWFGCFFLECTPLIT